MKIKVLLFILLGCAFAKNGVSQTSAFTKEDVSGIYSKGYNATSKSLNFITNTKLTLSITLAPDGRFEYHNFRQLEDQEEEHWWARGNWVLEGKVIQFSTTADDINEQYDIDLNNTKARFFKKSPRNKSSKPQPTYIQFYESENRVLKHLKLFKTNE